MTSHSKQCAKKFALYLDESGSPKPNVKDECPFFAMGGVLVEEQHETSIKDTIAAFKSRWKIPESTALHGNEIRSRKKNFAFLGTLPTSEQDDFMTDLTKTIISCQFLAHACVVSRSGYCDRYSSKYGSNTWEMMKSAFSIVVERSAKYADMNNGKLMVYFEKSGKNEDTRIKQYFNDLRSSGNPFSSDTSQKYSPLTAKDFSKILVGINSKSKNDPLIQLSDLCLYPVARSKTNSNDKGFTALRDNNLLIDCKLQLDNIPSLGIKYYCFDS